MRFNLITMIGLVLLVAGALVALGLVGVVAGQKKG